MLVSSNHKQILPFKSNYIKPVTTIKKVSVNDLPKIMFDYLESLATKNRLNIKRNYEITKLQEINGQKIKIWKAKTHGTKIEGQLNYIDDKPHSFNVSYIYDNYEIEGEYLRTYKGDVQESSKGKFILSKGSVIDNGSTVLTGNVSKLDEFGAPCEFTIHKKINTVNSDLCSMDIKYKIEKQNRLISQECIIKDVNDKSHYYSINDYGKFKDLLTEKFGIGIIISIDSAHEQANKLYEIFKSLT